MTREQASLRYGFTETIPLANKRVKQLLPTTISKLRKVPSLGLTERTSMDASSKCKWQWSKLDPLKGTVGASVDSVAAVVTEAAASVPTEAAALVPEVEEILELDAVTATGMEAAIKATEAVLELTTSTKEMAVGVGVDLTEAREEMIEDSPTFRADLMVEGAGVDSTVAREEVIEEEDSPTFRQDQETGPAPIQAVGIITSLGEPTAISATLTDLKEQEATMVVVSEEVEVEVDSEGEIAGEVTAEKPLVETVTEKTTEEVAVVVLAVAQ